VSQLEEFIISFGFFYKRDRVRH